MIPLLANENIPWASILRLREWGYRVASILEESPGITDVEVLERAVKEHRILLTFDRDYGELVYRRNLAPPPGIIFFASSPLHLWNHLKF
jgi:predicted nuclease of predicted toxin-antitoxin system